MDIQSIKTFIEVASLENFTKAAEELNYAQSTVTMQIQRLEEELGFPLFERIGRKNYLTAAGQEFLPHAVEMLRIIQKVGTLGHELSEMTGTLRIGALESLMFSSALHIIPQLHNYFPNIDIQLKLGQTSELLTLLKQNQLDLVYASYSSIEDPLLVSCYKRREEVIFIAGPQHPLASRKKIPLDELLTYPFIVAEPSGRCYGMLHEIASRAGKDLRHPVTVDDIEAICLLLPNEQSISFLPEYSLTDKLKCGKIIKLDVDIPPQIFYSQLIYHKNKWLSPYMERFIDMVREYRPERD